LHIGPGAWNGSIGPNPHCLTRDFAPEPLSWLTSARVATLMLTRDYSTFDRTIVDYSPADVKSKPSLHGGGHLGVGGSFGTVRDFWASPSDPIFYLHHTNMDRLYWLWQKQNLAVRLHEVGGPVIPRDFSGPNVTLDFEINVGPIGPLPLKDLLDIRGSLLCYDYD